MTDFSIFSNSIFALHIIFAILLQCIAVYLVTLINCSKLYDSVKFWLKDTKFIASSQITSGYSDIKLLWIVGSVLESTKCSITYNQKDVFKWFFATKNLDLSFNKNI